MARLELDDHVNVVVGPEVVTKNRTEQRQPLDVMSLAEGRHCIPIY